MIAQGDERSRPQGLTRATTARSDGEGESPAESQDLAKRAFDVLELYDRFNMRLSGIREGWVAAPVSRVKIMDRKSASTRGLRGACRGAAEALGGVAFIVLHPISGFRRGSGWLLCSSTASHVHQLSRGGRWAGAAYWRTRNERVSQCGIGFGSVPPTQSNSPARAGKGDEWVAEDAARTNGPRA